MTTRAPQQEEGAKPRVTAHTRVLCLLGDPVEHSLSPVMQNAAILETGVDGVYVALRCDDEQVPSLMTALARAGGAGNVTLPHKERAATVVDVPSDAVRRTGACNTFWGVDGKIHGDNTDVEGFQRALQAFLQEEPAGSRVLVLGAGGAARAILVGLLDDGVDEVLLLNRTVERARAVARRIGGERVRVAPGPSAVEGESFDLVVNATRLGLSPDDPLPLDLDGVGDLGAVMDLVYGEGGTPLVRIARERGIPATDGAEMLVRQGAVSFERWWERHAPVDVMRRALVDS
ncbi:MAG: shikimate dehydrogenase [Longimicrobiales bacterium]|nr:shikimate dehydrogenase [Longimicrobiales bacterium]